MRAAYAEVSVKVQSGGQLCAFEADWCDVLAFAGERGAGKSIFQLAYQLDGVEQYENAHRGAMFRKTYPELEDLQLKAQEVFGQAGGVFHSQPSARYPVSNCWYWGNGAQVRMRYIENQRDYQRYHGHDFSRLSFDEVTEYDSPTGFLLMLSTLRSPWGVHCTARLTGNPGGVGHVWMKMMFRIMSHDWARPFTDQESGLTFMYVPAKLGENMMLPNREQYVRTLLAATHGNEPLRRAWLFNDWTVVAGAFFSEWDERRHVLKDFTPPSWWARFTATDWGSARPFSTGWYAVATDDTRWKNAAGERVEIPRGAIVRYKEYYGIKTSEAGVEEYNTGLKMSVEDWASEVKKRSKGEDIRYNAVDTSMFDEDGGPSMAERSYKGAGLPLQRSDKRRIPGWQQVRHRLQGTEDDRRPLLYVTEGCKHFRRTFPALQHDQLKIEDVDTDGEDHCFSGNTLVSTRKGVYALSRLVGSAGLVLSSDGEWHPFVKARLVALDQPMLTLSFDNEESVTCTPDHKFMTTRGWVQAKDMLGLRVLQLSRRQFRNFSALVTTCAEPTSSAKAAGSIGQFGSWQTGRCRKDFISIMSMAMSRITRSATFAFCSLVSTLAHICGSPSARNSLGECSIVSATALRSGTKAPQDVSGIKSSTKRTARQRLPGVLRSAAIVAGRTSSACLETGRGTARPHVDPRREGAQERMTNNANARFAAPSSWSTRTLSKEPAHEYVEISPALTLGAECLRIDAAPRQNAYCLTVPETGNFALANGMVVHNCGDELRYACMSRPLVVEQKKVPTKHQGNVLTFDRMMQLTERERRAQSKYRGA